MSDAPSDIRRGDRVRNKTNGAKGTAQSGNNSGTIQVKQDDGVHTAWSVYDSEKITQ